MSNVYLCAATNLEGSTSSTLLCSKEEWESMSEEEQQQMIGEFMGDVVDIWVSMDDEVNGVIPPESLKPRGKANE